MRDEQLWTEIRKLQRQIRALQDSSVRRSQKRHGLYIPLATYQPVVDGSAVNVGTYVYNIADYTIPHGVSAVQARLMARWTSASNSNTARLTGYNSGLVFGVVRAQVASVYDIVTTPATVEDDRIKLVVAGDNAQGLYLILYGYFTGNKPPQ